MRILWLTVDRSQRIAKHFDDFRRAVEKIADVVTVKKHLKTCGDGRGMWAVARKLAEGSLGVDDLVLDHLSNDSDYDYIFCDAFFAYLEEPWGEFLIPSGIFIEDVHHDVPRIQVEKAGEFNIETIFHRFNFPFHKFHRKARVDFRCIWLPHSINMERFTDNIEKDKDILHTGVVNRHFYPHRCVAVNLLKNKSYFTLVERPRDSVTKERSKNWPIDRDYDNLLQSARICITGGSAFNAPVQKYVEIPAAGSVLMSNWFPDLGLMGFRDGYNMVAYCKENVVDAVEELLGDEEKIREVSKNGLDLILERHTSEIRSMQFVNFICTILGKRLEFPDVQPCSFQVNFKGRHLDVVNGSPVFDKQEQKQKKKDKPIQLDPKRKPRSKTQQRLIEKGVVRGTDWRSRITKAKCRGCR